ncbi:MAG: hypothetical protein KA807_09635 [Prolixibacteraceae bacterium]|nr:hypothetical protein [Prolixibacteraceae bacterium]
MQKEFFLNLLFGGRCIDNNSVGRFDKLEGRLRGTAPDGRYGECTGDESGIDRMIYISVYGRAKHKDKN